MLKALYENKDRIIKLKKSAVYKSVEKGQFAANISNLRANAVKGLQMESGNIYPVINTTNYMDSHDDVHFPGLWDRSLNDQQGKIFYAMGHNLNIKDIIAWPEDVNAFVKELQWKELGADFDGTTQALIYEIPEDKIVNDDARKVLDEKRKVQNSVSMRYILIKFGADSNESYMKEAKAYFDEMIDKIANKEQVKEQGYFYGVEEAAIHKEGSMVLFGSNDITPILLPEPPEGTSGKTEPPAGTQKNNILLNLI